MANYATLKAAIADVVKTNGEQEITGANLQSVLLAIVNSIGAEYTFAGVATPSTSAGTPDQNVFYVAGAGTYANFGNTVNVLVGHIGIFKYNGTWSFSQIDMTEGQERFDILGKGSNVSDITHQVKAGNTYLLWIKNPDISLEDVTQETSAALRFSVRPFDASGQRIGTNDLIFIGMDTRNNPLANYYKFTAPALTDYVEISIRAATGAILTGWFEDVTHTESMTNSLVAEDDSFKTYLKRTNNLAKITGVGQYINASGEVVFSDTFNSSLIRLENGHTYYVYQSSAYNIRIFTLSGGIYTQVTSANVNDWNYTVPDDGSEYYLQGVVNRQTDSLLMVVEDEEITEYVPLYRPYNENAIISAPRMFNPSVELTAPTLKILDIGNSYTKDSTHYLPEILSAAGATDNFSLYAATRGSGSFKTWYNCYNDSDGASYEVAKVAGQTIEGVTTGTGAANNGELFRNLLQYGGWDIIIIHQVSTYSTDYSVWNGNGDGGYLKEFLRVIKKFNAKASIGHLLVHSYRSTYSQNKEHSSLLRWQKIVTATKEFMRDYGIDFVIPYGTAVQNLRASSISDEYEFSTDGTHMADGIGDYVSACAYYQTVFAPRFGADIIGNSWRKVDFDETIHGVKNISNTNALLAQKAAYCAVLDMFSITNPNDVVV